MTHTVPSAASLSLFLTYTWAVPSDPPLSSGACLCPGCIWAQGGHRTCPSKGGCDIQPGQASPHSWNRTLGALAGPETPTLCALPVLRPVPWAGQPEATLGTRTLYWPRWGDGIGVHGRGEGAGQGGHAVDTQGRGLLWGLLQHRHLALSGGSAMTGAPQGDPEGACWQVSARCAISPSSMGENLRVVYRGGTAGMVELHAGDIVRAMGTPLMRSWAIFVTAGDSKSMGTTVLVHGRRVPPKTPTLPVVVHGGPPTVGLFCPAGHRCQSPRNLHCLGRGKTTPVSSVGTHLCPIVWLSWGGARSPPLEEHVSTPGAL